jgi:hypothetical protein
VPAAQTISVIKRDRHMETSISGVRRRRTAKVPDFSPGYLRS